MGGLDRRIRDALTRKQQEKLSTINEKGFRTTFLNMASGYEALFHARQSLEPKFALDLTEVDEPEPVEELPTDDNAEEEIGMVSCSIEWNQDNSEQQIFCAV